ncbi:hypothetical protein BKA70DRAFT_1426816 [Coprinopsis sp. MPI-PUGE-AT-0042]|nr:hypothetical protein BKA70DRAFT_1426816 [Coprinopsis sp. MPI-PUGE-AT-0042]
MQLMHDLALNLTTATVALDSDTHHDGGYYGLKFLEPSSSDSNSIHTLRDIEVFLGIPNRALRRNPRERSNLTHHWPRLSSLSVFCNRDTCPTSIDHQSLSTLALRFAHLPAEDVEFILGRLPQLEELSLLRCTPLRLEHGEILEPATEYTHHALRRVNVHDGIPEPFLSRLQCPSLSMLIADGKPGVGDLDREMELACLEQLMERSGASIPFGFQGKTYRLRTSNP